MTLPQLFIPLLMAGATPVTETPQPIQPPKMEFPLAGYRINALDSATKDFFNITMFLPVSKNSFNGFSYKVDVSSQALKEGRPSLQSQVKETRSYFTQSGNAILLDREPSPTEWEGEFTTMGRDKAGPKEHLYERMIYANGRSYFIAAIAPDAQWKDVGPKMKACVDSFEPSPEPVPGKVSFPQQGFRFSVLDGAAPADAKQTMLRLPAMGFMGPTIEPYAKTIEDYKAERKPPMMADPKHKFKIVAENAPEENALVTEYAEEIPPGNLKPQGSEALSYEKVFLAHGQLYRVSAMLLNTDAMSSAQIKACVESLEALPAPAPAPAPLPAPVPAPAPTPAK